MYKSTITKLFNKILVEATKRDILQSALRYTNQRDWHKNEPHLFKKAVNYKYRVDRKFWDECTSHMEYIFKPNGYWSYDRCLEVVKDYTDKNSLAKEHPQVMKAIYRNGWFDLISDMVSLSKNGKVIRSSEEFDTLEKCKAEALKYTSRSQVLVECSLLYKTVLKNDWDDICFSHMKRQTNIKKRFIYVFEFSETGRAYVGLTYNIERRKRAHLGHDTRYGKVKSNVYKHMIETGVEPKFKIITKRPVAEDRARMAEKKWIEYYKKNGWVMLNIARGGSLGSMRKKTIDHYLDIKSQCKTLSEFMKKISSHERSTLRKDGLWQNLIYGLRVDFNIWTPEKVISEADKYAGWSRYKLQKSASGYYKALLRHGLIDSLFPIKEDSGPTYSECKEVASRYDIYSEFRNKEREVYLRCRFKNWNELTQHMKRNVARFRKPIESKYTLEICKELAIGMTRSEFGKSNSGAFKFLSRMGLVDEVFPKKEKPGFRSKYTFEICKELSKQCVKRSDFQKKYSGAYKFAKKNDLLDLIYPKK